MATQEFSANVVPLTPLSFLKRAGNFLADKTAIVDRNHRLSYAQFLDRARKLAGALNGLGVRHRDRVAVMAPNVPQMLVAHYAIPMIGAVLVPLNPELDADSIAESLLRFEVRCLIVDGELQSTARPALQRLDDSPQVIVMSAGDSPDDALDYEELVSNSTPIERFDVVDEMQSLSLLSTSGTTGEQKTAIYSYRGAYLAALSNALSFGLDHNSVYLWTWPMFHSHGLSFIWAVTAVGATHVCERDLQVSRVFDLIDTHGVTHFCVVPTVLNELANDPAARACPSKVTCIVGGAAPATSSVAKLESLGFEVIHQYGSSECYGPVTVCWRGRDWDRLGAEERSARMLRQGTMTPIIEDLIVADLDGPEPVPRDGKTLGEIALRSNTVMQGYFADSDATISRIRDGWYRTGDIAVWHPDGSIEIKDRAADLIVSGGRRISSVEIDEALHSHPDVLDAAVIAMRDEQLGQVPCAFIACRPGAEVSVRDLQDFCRNVLDMHKVPRRFEFAQLPRTATGKIKKSELRRRIARE